MWEVGRLKLMCGFAGIALLQDSRTQNEYLSRLAAMEPNMAYFKEPIRYWCTRQERMARYLPLWISEKTWKDDFCVLQVKNLRSGELICGRSLWTLHLRQLIHRSTDRRSALTKPEISDKSSLCSSTISEFHSLSRLAAMEPNMAYFKESKRYWCIRQDRMAHLHKR